MLNAIIVDQRWRILSGTRRWKACKILAERHESGKFNHIPVRVFKGTELEAERLLIHANRQRQKTLEEMTREYREVLRLEAKLAKQRMVATLKKGTKAPAREKFPKRGRAADIAAKATGLSAKTLNKFLRVIDEADKGDAEARMLVDRVNLHVCRPTRAYERLFPKIEMRPARPCGSEFSTLLADLNSKLTLLGRLVQTTAEPSVRTDTKALVDSLRKLSVDAGERADRLEDALRIASVRKVNKLAVCDISPRAPLSKWLNKIHCSDCLTVLKQMPAGSIPLIVTSPPYNLRNSAGNGMKFGGGEWPKALVFNAYDSSDDAMPHREYVAWLRKCLKAMMRVLRDDGAIFLNHKRRVQNGVLQDRADIVAGFPVRQIIVWERNCGINLNAGYFLPRHEIIYLICKPNFKLAPNVNVLGDVWHIPREADVPHPHPFPVGLAQCCIQCTTAEIVVDPFSGSGSTAIAAENLKRSWIGIDISKKYCQMAEKRIEKARITFGSECA